MRAFTFLAMIVASVTAYAQQFQWAKKMGSTGYDFGSAITTDADGNSFITGSFQGTVDFDPGSGISNKTSAGGSDVFVLKLDSDGNLSWVKTLGGINDEEVGSIAVDAVGNIYTTGGFVGVGDFDPGGNVYELVGFHDVFISKLNASGDFVWAKSVGGGANDYGVDLTVDVTGNVHIIGYFEGGGDYDPGEDEFYIYTGGGYGTFILRLDIDGNFEWVKILEGTGDTLGRGESITVDADGNTYSIGEFTNKADFDTGAGVYELQSIGGFDIFILKLDPDGEFIWAKQMGGTSNDYGIALTLDLDQNICFAGMFEGTCDFDPGPGTNNLTANGKEDFFISKLEPDGKFSWARSVGSSESETINSIATDPAGNVFTSGLFKGKVDFDPGVSILNLVAKGTFDPDAFILELSDEGNFISCQRIGGNETDQIFVTVDDNGIIYAAGFFSGNIDLGPGVGIFTSSGTYDLLILKMNPSITGTETPAISSFEVFPNPATDYLRVSGDYIQRTEIIITDQCGQEVLREALVGFGAVIDIRNLGPGLYYIKLEGRVRKFVKL